MWLHLEGYMIWNNAVKPIQDHLEIVHELPLIKTVDLGNIPIDIIRRMGMVTCLHSSHFQGRRSVINILHSTWHPVRNQPPAQAKDILVMGHSGKDMTSTKGDMTGLKCSPLRRFQDNGRHHQVHRECLQDCLKTIHSIGQHPPALIFHMNLLPAHLEDRQLASPRNNCSRQRTCRKLMPQGMRPCLHWQRLHMTIMVQLMRATFHRTWAVQKGSRQSAWSQPNSLWRHLPQGLGRPTTVHASSGRKYWWQWLWRRSIGQWSVGRTIWNSFEMDPRTGWLRLQIS